MDTTPQKKQPAAELLGALLDERGETLATAESCTGGYLSHRITSIAGSSAYFLGGVVSYSNQIKITMLGVAESDLVVHGAVSEVVCRQMLNGAQDRFGATYAIATTGIAGPGGGSAEKPVGLVYVGAAGPKKANIERCVFEGDRLAVITQSAERGLQMLLDLIDQQTTGN